MFRKYEVWLLNVRSYDYCNEECEEKLEKVIIKSLKKKVEVINDYDYFFFFFLNWMVEIN